MKKASYPLLILLVFFMIILSGCDNNKQLETTPFDYGGVVVDIPNTLSLNGDYYKEMRNTNDSVTFTDGKNGIIITCMPGLFVPDDSTNYINENEKILESKKLTIGGYEARYKHSSINYQGTTTYYQSLAVYPGDRAVIVQSTVVDSKFDKQLKPIFDNVKISTNQYYFPGFGNTEVIPTENTPVETAKPTAQPLPLPTPQPEYTEPVRETEITADTFDFYSYKEVEIAVPKTFKFAKVYSNDQTSMFVTDNYEGFIQIDIANDYSYPSDYHKGSFGPTFATVTEYNQESFEIDGIVVKSYISYYYDGQIYHEFDIVVCLLEGDLNINMYAPESYLSDLLVAFRYTGVYSYVG